MKKLCFLVALSLSVLFIQSCKKEAIENPNEQLAPSLPPLESFVMPFAGYEEIDTTGLTNPDIELDERSGPTTFRNWFYAGSNVLVWNLIIGVNMAIPVASFAEAFNHDPVYDGNGAFVWSYDFTLAGQTYLASLSGRFINNDTDVEWVMNISQVGDFTNVEWYRGVVSRDRSQASWTLNHRPENPEPFLSIDYQRNSNTGEFSIQYTNIIPNHPDNGHYIAYSTHIDGAFNRAYDVYRGSEDNFLEIEWNAPSREGRVRNQREFNDNDWHCWDTELMDVDC